MKYTILITVATHHEQKALKSYWEECTRSMNLRLRFLITGIGNIAMTHALTEHLCEKTGIYDFVLNIGIAGMLTEKTQKEIRQIAQTRHFSSGKEMIFPIFLRIAPLATILSSDCAFRETLGDSAPLGDMESYGFAYVMEGKDIPYLCLKAPFDQVGTDFFSSKKSELESTLQEAIDPKALFTQILTYLEKHPRPMDLSPLRDQYRLTFTEYHQCRELLTSLSALERTDPESILTRVRARDKQELLSTLRHLLASFSHT